MHAADLKKSSRLQNCLSAMADCLWHTTAWLQEATGSMAVHSDIAELRANNVSIETKYVARLSNGRKVYAYRLVHNNVAA
jgi:hypothetical protein